MTDTIQTVTAEKENAASQAATINQAPRRNNNRRINPNYRRPCRLCQQGVLSVDYKDVELLKNYLISYNGKIKPRKVTGCCCKHQRFITNAIKRARIVALLPFVNK